MRHRQIVGVFQYEFRCRMRAADGQAADRGAADASETVLMKLRRVMVCICLSPEIGLAKKSMQPSRPHAVAHTACGVLPELSEALVSFYSFDVF